MHIMQLKVRLDRYVAQTEKRGRHGTGCRGFGGQPTAGVLG
jgi:hypothetical protein